MAPFPGPGPHPPVPGGEDQAREGCSSQFTNEETEAHRGAGTALCQRLCSQASDHTPRGASPEDGRGAHPRESPGDSEGHEVQPLRPLSRGPPMSVVGSEPREVSVRTRSPTLTHALFSINWCVVPCISATCSLRCLLPVFCCPHCAPASPLPASSWAAPRGAARAPTPQEPRPGRSGSPRRSARPQVGFEHPDGE